MMELVQEAADALAEELGGIIYWDNPIREAVYG
jgi:hypothetical protein